MKPSSRRRQRHQFTRLGKAAATFSDAESDGSALQFHRAVPPLALVKLPTSVPRTRFGWEWPPSSQTSTGYTKFVDAASGDREIRKAVETIQVIGRGAQFGG